MPSDRRLARRATDGDRRAFSAIYERYHQELYRFCLAITRDSQDAQDALQNTMVKALRSLPGERREIRLKPWLYRIAHNEAVETIRRRRPDEQPLEWIGADGDAVEPAAHGGGGEVSTAVESRDRLRTLLADIGELPERQRAALVMRELGDLGFEEIGSSFDSSAAVARQTVYEARLSLRQMEEGREMSCDRVRWELSAADGRVSKRRDLRAHLRDCSECRAFQSSIGERRRDLAALAPLPAVASAALLHSVLGSASGAGGAGGLAGGGAAAGSSAGGGAAAGGGGLAGGGAAAGSVAGKAAAGPLIAKAVATVAVLAAGVAAADRSGVIDTPIPGGGGSHAASQSTAPGSSGPAAAQPGAGAGGNAAANAHRGGQTAGGPTQGGAAGGHSQAGSGGSGEGRGSNDEPGQSGEHGGAGNGESHGNSGAGHGNRGESHGNPGAAHGNSGASHGSSAGAAHAHGGRGHSHTGGNGNAAGGRSPEQPSSQGGQGSGSGGSRGTAPGGGSSQGSEAQHPSNPGAGQAIKPEKSDSPSIHAATQNSEAGLEAHAP